jgi:hypothetical protein
MGPPIRKRRPDQEAAFPRKHNSTSLNSISARWAQAADLADLRLERDVTALCPLASGDDRASYRIRLRAPAADSDRFEGAPEAQ